MKFGKHLDTNAAPEWKHFYLNYSLLKTVIKESVQQNAATGALSISTSPRNTSFSVLRSDTTDYAEAKFARLMESELQKVSSFIEKEVDYLRRSLRALDNKVQNMQPNQRDAFLEEANSLGQRYLQLEKYANLNYLGVHKILKKHDKLLPTLPCRHTFIPRLHDQPWVQGNYSDVLVQLSMVFSKLRGDMAGDKNEDSAQGFVRSTTKYWVHKEDVSVVKYHILQNLPVFQFNTDNFAGDAQLINSVYFDNANLELYHGRLDKKPGAIALRLRWYGAGPIKHVFVERKTHRDSWKGEESVKERFVLPEDKVVPFLEGEYTLDMAIEDLRAAGKSDKDVENFSRLFTEIYQQVDSKQLHPLVRTQYMRTAFQIPHDSTVRVSLDANLCMIKENPDDTPSCMELHRWYRDPDHPPKSNEITKFPHSVLEVKLALKEGEKAPEWVQALLDSGYLVEVHKFSKFLHGTCTLMPDLVQALPYWVDEASIKASILASQTSQVESAIPIPGTDDLEVVVANGNGSTPPLKPRKRAPIVNNQLAEPLLGRDAPLHLMPEREDVKGFQPPVHPLRAQEPVMPPWFYKVLCLPRHPGQIMRMEPKTVFANERTYLSWLHMAVTIGSTAAALLGFANLGGTAENPEERAVAVMALVMLPLAVLICAYAVFTFVWRGRLIARKQVGHYDDQVGPLVLAAAVLLALGTILGLGVTELAKDLENFFHPPSPTSPVPAMTPTLSSSMAT